ncbi:MAG: isoprenyl transferase [Phycisphaerales bacterium]|nr:isoprenyl transferase [Phycisphaerales bacterium]
MSQEPTSAESSIKRPTAPPESWPKHVAMIMDGNGRWAAERDQPRIFGHQQGANTVRMAVEHCRALGIEALTLYSFSSENWKRPQAEIDALMQLCTEHLVNERASMVKNGIRLRWIGRESPLPPSVVKELRKTEEATSGCEDMQLVLAINYGSRDEIVDAARSLATDVAEGRVRPEEIDPDLLESRLYTAGLPDPDLLIRTAGERRLSNYLLWQISYAELHVTDLCWPDFDLDALNDAIDDFASRKRRYGGITPASG